MLVQMLTDRVAQGGSCLLYTSQSLSPSDRQVAHVLLTRPPLRYMEFHPKTSSRITPFDLHVLGAPPAFVLSQDQTLNK